MSLIKDLQDGQRVNALYLVNNVSKGVTNTGSPYLSVTLQDKSGTIEAKIWAATPEDEELYVVGNIVNIVGDVNNYRDALQLKIQSGELMYLEPEQVSQFVPSSPYTMDELKVRLDTYLASFKEGDLKELVNTLIKKHYSEFLIYPAAVKNHHEFAGGLAHHTLDMADLGEAIAKLYPQLDRDLLIAGILVHDLGKVIELSGPVLPKYTDVGKLIGHISLCAAEILATAKELNTNEEIATLLTHMVLAHHGKMEYGSPITPKTQEALTLSMIDDYDSKMMMLSKAYDEIEPGEFTARQWALDNGTFYKAKNDEE